MLDLLLLLALVVQVLHQQLVLRGVLRDRLELRKKLLHLARRAVRRLPLRVQRLAKGEMSKRELRAAAGWMADGAGGERGRDVRGLRKRKGWC